MIRFLHQVSRIIGPKQYGDEKENYARIIVFILFFLAFAALGALIIVYALKNRPTVQSSESIYDYAGGASFDAAASANYYSVMDLLAVNKTKAIYCGCTYTVYQAWPSDINHSEAQPCLDIIDASNPYRVQGCQDFDDSLKLRLQDFFLPFDFNTVDPETWMARLQYAYSGVCDLHLRDGRTLALMQLADLAANQTAYIEYNATYIEGFWDTLLANSSGTRPQQYDTYGMCWLGDTKIITLVPEQWAHDYIEAPPPYPPIPVLVDGKVTKDSKGNSITWYDDYVTQCQPYFCFWFGVQDTESVLISTLGTIGTIFSVTIAVASIIYLCVTSVERKIKKRVKRVVRNSTTESVTSPPFGSTTTSPDGSRTPTLAQEPQELRQIEEEEIDEEDMEINSAQVQQMQQEMKEMSKEFEEKFRNMDDEIQSLKQELSKHQEALNYQQLLLTTVTQILQEKGISVTREMKNSVSMPAPLISGSPDSLTRKTGQSISNTPPGGLDGAPPIRRVKRKRKDHDRQLTNGRRSSRDMESDEAPRGDCQVREDCTVM